MSPCLRGSVTGGADLRDGCLGAIFPLSAYGGCITGCQPFPATGLSR